MKDILGLSNKPVRHPSLAAVLKQEFQDHHRQLPKPLFRLHALPEVK